MSSRITRRATAAAITTLGVALSAAPGNAAELGRSVAVTLQTVQVQQPARIEVGTAPRGWLGANFQILTGGPGRDMVLVTGMFPDAPAFAGGIRPGDEIVRVNGVAVSGDMFRSVASRLGPGDPIALTVRRGNTTMDIALRAGERPAEETLLPRLIQIEIDSAQAVFQTRLRLVEQAGAENGVFFSAPNLRVVGADGQFQIVTQGQGPTASGRFQIAQNDGTSMSFEVRFPSADEARPLLTWIQGDSVTSGWIGERQVLERRLTDLVAQVENVQRFGTPVDREQRDRTLRELERALYETETRLSQVRDANGNSLSLRLIEPLGEDVVVSSRQGVTVVPRPLAPYVTGRNRVAGAELQEMDRDLANYFKVDVGLLVTDVAEGSPAENAGLLSGDVLRSVNGIAVSSVAQFREILARYTADRMMEVVRRGTTVRLQMR